ncbi:hypothetical protein ACYJ1Y_01900 [Natrialbaceae archaeon A-gly3]
MDDSRTVQWRRDPATSRTVRVLRSLGGGGLLAAIILIVFARFFAFTGLTSGQPVVIAIGVALAATIFALAISSNPGGSLARIFDPLPISGPESDGIKQVLDAAVGAVVVATYMLAMTILVGGNVGNFAAAVAVPVAVILLILSSFLQSVGTLDLDENRLYLHEPEVAIDLAELDDVSYRTVGDMAVVKLVYAQPDGQYVAGPRRLTTPPEIAREVQGIVRSRT